MERGIERPKAEEEELQQGMFGVVEGGRASENTSHCCWSM